MLPALELPEGAEIRVAVVQAHLEEQGDNNEPSSLLVSQSVSAFTFFFTFFKLERIIGMDMDKGKKYWCFIACCWQRALQKVKLSARLKGRSDPWVEIWINK